MTRTTILSLKLAVAAVIGIGVSANSASAQSITASFVLPYEVSWGRAVLSAGAYTITFSSHQGPAIIRNSSGEGRALVMPMTVSRELSDEPSSLVLTRGESGHDVAFLNLREANLSFGYRLSKSGPKVGKIAEPVEVTIVQQQ
jgi:hypothetical protein